MKLLWYLGLFLLMSTTCPCTRTFKNTRLLGIHQNACDVFRNEQSIGDKRAMAGESALDRRQRKRQRKDLEAAALEAEQSTSSFSFAASEVCFRIRTYKYPYTVN